MYFLLHFDATLHVYVDPLQFSNEAADSPDYDFEFLRLCLMSECVIHSSRLCLLPDFRQSSTGPKSYLSVFELWLERLSFRSDLGLLVQIYTLHCRNQFADNSTHCDLVVSSIACVLIRRPCDCADDSLDSSLPGNNVCTNSPCCSTKQSRDAREEPPDRVG